MAPVFTSNCGPPGESMASRSPLTTPLRSPRLRRVRGFERIAPLALSLAGPPPPQLPTLHRRAARFLDRDLDAVGRPALARLSADGLVVASGRARLCHPDP